MLKKTLCLVFAASLAMAQAAMAQEETEAMEMSGEATHSSPDTSEQMTEFVFSPDSEDAYLTLGPGRPSTLRHPACTTENLRGLLEDTQADLGDNLNPQTLFKSFPQLREILESDSDDKAYVWFAQCNPEDTEGLVCVATTYDLSQGIGITLDACAYGEGVVEHNTGDTFQ